MDSGSTLRAVHLEILQLLAKASPGGSGEPLHEGAHHISLDRLRPEDCKSRQGFDQHIDESHLHTQRQFDLNYILIQRK